jgi:ParB-like chromosome segregation protein Spo0J
MTAQLEFVAMNGNSSLQDLVEAMCARINGMDLDAKVEALNFIKSRIHSVSPFKHEPVDCVLWVKNGSVHANDYNPNSVAPPEMELLRVSITEDGYTQPIVTFQDADNSREVIDGFHRNRVGKECEDVARRVHGFLPVVTINESRKDKTDRMAATIRHNRARGKHKVDSMSDIVVELKRRNWSDDKISRELGMDPDEVLRLTQVSGLAEMFKDSDFSKSWEAGDCDSDLNESDFDSQ